MRRTVIHFFTVSLVLTIMGWAFVGCTIAKPIEIKYYGMWTWDPYLELENALIDRFNKVYEGKIHVTAMSIPGAGTLDLSKLFAMVAGGSPPDVAKIDRFQTGSLASQGVLQELDDLIRRDEVDLKQFFPPTVQEAEYKGKIYAIPWYTTDLVLYYNAGLFEELGLDPKAPPKTWEDMDVYCSKIDLQNPNRTWKRVGFTPWEGNWYFPGWLWAAGGDLLDKTNTKVTWAESPGIQAAEWMQKYVRRYGWAVTYEKGPKTWGPSWPLWTGELAMLMHGSYLLADIKRYAPDIRFDVAPAPRPRGLEKEPVTWCGGHALAIPVGVPREKRDAAWEFIKFYTYNEWAQTLLGVKSGQIPVLAAAAFSKEFLDMDPLIKKALSLMRYGRFRPVIPAGDELWKIYYNQFNTLLSQDKMSARQIVEETAKLGQVALDNAWKRAKIK